MTQAGRQGSPRNGSGRNSAGRNEAKGAAQAATPAASPAAAAAPALASATSPQGDGRPLSAPSRAKRHFVDPDNPTTAGRDPATAARQPGRRASLFPQARLQQARLRQGARYSRCNQAQTAKPARQYAVQGLRQRTLRPEPWPRPQAGPQPRSAPGSAAVRSARC